MSVIAVVGGTGFTGNNLVKEAASRGHQVVSLSRSGPADAVEGIQYVQGDVAAATADVFAGADVIIGALSPRAGTEGTLVETYTRLARIATEQGAQLVVIGGFSSLRPSPGAPRFADSGAVPEAFAAEANEVNLVRVALEETAPKDLDWLFISPAAEYGGYLPQGEPRRTYRTSTDVALFDENGTSAISGADFALAVLNAIDDGEHHRTQLHFAY